MQSFYYGGLNLPLIELFAKELIANIDKCENVLLLRDVKEILAA